MPRSSSAFLFDLDGTLVDSVYQHVLAWKEALDREGLDLSVWRIHRKIGMSGGLFTNILLRETGLDITEERLARLREYHAEAYRRFATECAVQPLPGSRELLSFLTAQSIPWAIATSGRMETAGPNIASLGVDPNQVPVITRDLVRRRQAGRGYHPVIGGGRQHLGHVGRSARSCAWHRLALGRLWPRRA